MQQATYDITLQRHIIISQQAATAGAHRCLDYIPGSVLLGLAASRLYAQLDKDSAWTLFHSGLVRFGDALPTTGNQTGFPVPISWHHYKGDTQRRTENGIEYFKTDVLFDPSQFETEKTRQPVQLRSGYTTLSGQYIAPGKVQTLKNAIDLAAKSQLFGYEALEAGQTFRFTLSGDGIDQKLWQQLIETLEGKARLGRSRSAQYGKVKIQSVEGKPLPTPDNEPRTLTLWLLSDLLLEHNGQPCLQPHAELLGLPKGSEWLPDKSFLRSRQYSIYNAYRRHYESERQVISRGSVLRYNLSEPLSQDALANLQCGIGLHIEAGLGQVLVNPPLLKGERPSFSVINTVINVTAQEKPREPDSPLLAALRARQYRQMGEQDIARNAKAIFDQLCQRILEARSYCATTEGELVSLIIDKRLVTAPGRSQWGNMKQLANDHRQNSAQLWKALTDTNNGAIRARSGWELPYGPSKKQTLGTWLQGCLDQHKEKEDFPRLLGHLAVLGLEPRWINCCEGTGEISAQQRITENGAAE